MRTKTTYLCVELVQEALARAGDGQVGEGGRTGRLLIVGESGIAERGHALAAVGGALLDVDERDDIVDERGARCAEEGVERGGKGRRVLTTNSKAIST